MKPLSLATIADLAGAQLGKGKGERVAFGVGIDSRTVKPGELFVAIRGPKNDGHEYVVAASEKGAIAASNARTNPSQKQLRENDSVRP